MSDVFYSIISKQRGLDYHTSLGTALFYSIHIFANRVRQSSRVYLTFCPERA